MFSKSLATMAVNPRPKKYSNMDPAEAIFSKSLAVNPRPRDDINSSVRTLEVHAHNDFSRTQRAGQKAKHKSVKCLKYSPFVDVGQKQQKQHDVHCPTVLDPTFTISGTFIDQKKRCELLLEAATKIENNVNETNQLRIEQATKYVDTARQVLDLATAQLTKVSQESKVDALVCAQNRVVANTIQQQTQKRIRDFRSNAEKTLHGLNFNETYEVLLILGVTTRVDLLTQQGINGDALVDMTENDMQSVFNMRTLGERRRLKKNIQILANNRGFPKPRHGQPGALGWGVAEVLAWLIKEGLGRCAHYFQQQDIDGPCLLQLTPDDLGQLGVSTVGERSTLRRKLESLKTHTYAGQFVANTTTTTTGATGSPSNSTHTMEAVLQAVLEQNRELLQRVEMADANPAVPPQCLCPILHAVMQDPVIALDGHTYDREAIATWFTKCNRSPMTNMEIEPILIPNLSVRQLIEALLATNNFK